MRGLFVGRFQPFHAGHLEVLRGARRDHPEEDLLVGIGSAQASYTVDNPFTAGERAEMVLRSVDEADLDRVQVVPLLDIDRHQLWVRYLEGLLPPFGRVYTNNPLTRMLFEAEDYPVEAVRFHDREHLEGRRIREEMADGPSWRTRLPPAAAAYVEELGGPDRMKRLREAAAAHVLDATRPA